MPTVALAARSQSAKAPKADSHLPGASSSLLQFVVCLAMLAFAGKIVSLPSCTIHFLAFLIISLATTSHQLRTKLSTISLYLSPSRCSRALVLDLSLLVQTLTDCESSSNLALLLDEGLWRKADSLQLTRPIIILEKFLNRSILAKVLSCWG